jgi:hypothetical protein
LPVEGHAFEATYNKDEKESTQWFCCRKKKADFKISEVAASLRSRYFCFAFLIGASESAG